MCVGSATCSFVLNDGFAVLLRDNAVDVEEVVLALLTLLFSALDDGTTTDTVGARIGLEFRARFSAGGALISILCAPPGVADTTLGIVRWPALSVDGTLVIPIGPIGRFICSGCGIAEWGDTDAIITTKPGQSRLK